MIAQVGMEERFAREGMEARFAQVKEKSCKGLHGKKLEACVNGEDEEKDQKAKHKEDAGAATYLTSIALAAITGLALVI